MFRKIKDILRLFKSIEYKNDKLVIKDTVVVDNLESEDTVACYLGTREGKKDEIRKVD